MVEADIDFDEDELVGSVHQRRAARKLKRENSMPRNARGKGGRALSPVRCKSGRSLSPLRTKSHRSTSPVRTKSHRRNSPHREPQEPLDDLLTPAPRISNVSPKAAAVAAAASTQQQAASLELSVELLQGKGLAACDTNIFGKETSSDPYVIVSIITQDNQEVKIGKTKHIPTTLNPKWNTTVTKVIPPGTIKGNTYTLQLTLMDYDMIGEDDCMGVVKIPMTMENASKGNNWYDVPEDSAEKASGKIQVGLESKLHYDVGSFLGNKKQPQAVPHVTPASVQQEEEEAPEERESALGLKSMLQTNAKGLLGVGGATAGLVLGAGKLMGTTALGAGTAVANTAIGAGTTVVNTTTNVGMSAAGAVVGADNIKMVTDKVKEVGDVATNATSAVGGFIKNQLLNEDSTSNSEKEDEMEDIYEEEEALELKLTLIKGDGLAPKDKNFIGRNVSSDPYVIVEIWPKGAPLEEDRQGKGEPVTLGRSKTINKSLDPVWLHKFDPCYVPIEKLDMEEAQLRIRIYDDDFGLGDDDPMGNVDIFLQPKKHMDIKEKWYHVSATSASGASGRVQLTWETNQMLHRRVVGQRRKAKQVVRVSEPEEDEMSASMPARLGDDHDQLMQAAIIAQDRRNKPIRASAQAREKRRMRRTASLPEEEEKERLRRSRRGQSSRGGDRASSKRSGSSRRMPADGSKQRSSSSRRELGDKHRSSRTRRSSHMDAPDSEKTKKSIRRTRSHLPTGEGEGSHRRSRSADPSSLLKKAGVSSRRTKDKEESRRSKSRRDEGTEGEKKRVSKSGRSSRRKSSSRVKGMDESGVSTSPRHEDDMPDESTSSRGGSDGVEERKPRVSSSGDKKLLKKKSSRGETSGRKKEGSNREKPSSRSSRSGAHHSSSKRESKSKRSSGDAPRPRSSKGGSEAAKGSAKGLLAECEELRASYLEAKPFLSAQSSRKAI